MTRKISIGINNFFLVALYKGFHAPEDRIKSPAVFTVGFFENFLVGFKYYNPVLFSQDGLIEDSFS